MAEAPAAAMNPICRIGLIYGLIHFARHRQMPVSRKMASGLDWFSSRNFPVTLEEHFLWFETLSTKLVLNIEQVRIGSYYSFFAKQS